MGKTPRILVIGDIMLDRYVEGRVSRISPEAPVPVVNVTKEWSTLGGAANVAANAAALGAEVNLIGAVGNDASAEELHALCRQFGVSAQTIATDQPTIVKTRVVSGQQIVRIDREQPLQWTADQLQTLFSVLDASISKADVLLLSDYAKGTLSDPVLDRIMAQAQKNSVRVLVDPKRSDWSKYAGAFVITPNLAELGMTGYGQTLDNEDNSIVSVCKALRSGYRVGHIVATRSSYGMTVVSEHGVLNIPTRALEVFDVSGAGDTVLAALGVSLAQGRTVAESAFVANAAAGTVVSKRGTAVVSATELEHLLRSNRKLTDTDTLLAQRKQQPTEKWVFTNGCFDVLHQGHRELLRQAARLGDRLIVGLNSDSSISRLKGPSRPVNAQQLRVEALSALPFVDAILVFEEDTPYQLLQQLRPDILVKGGDYNKDEVVGNDLVQQVVILPLVEGVSTTDLLNR